MHMLKHIDIIGAHAEFGFEGGVLSGFHLTKIVDWVGVGWIGLD